MAGGRVTDGPPADGPVVDGPVVDGPVADGPVVDGPVVDGPVVGNTVPAVHGDPESGPDSEPDALISRLRVIEGQPLDTRAEAFTQIYESLQAILGGAGGADAG